MIEAQYMQRKTDEKGKSIVNFTQHFAEDKDRGRVQVNGPQPFFKGRVTALFPAIR